MGHFWATKINSRQTSAEIFASKAVFYVKGRTLSKIKKNIENDGQFMEQEYRTKPIFPFFCGQSIER